MFHKLHKICLWAANLFFALIITSTLYEAAAADADISTKGFYVITALYNPTSFKRDYEVYHQYAAQMKETGAQLITIEVVFPALNQTEFIATSSDNPNHIQVKSESIYWVKEYLLNIAVEKLPADAKWVAWLCSYLFFEDKNWISLTVKELAKYLVVQVFEKAKFLGEPPHNEVLRTDYSFASAAVQGKPLEEIEVIPQPGNGWAMDVKSFREMGGLPEMDILYGGDLHFAFALLNKIPKSIKDNVHPELLETISKKSDQIFNTLDGIAKSHNKSLLGYVPTTLNHHWHGITTAGTGSSFDQWQILKAHKFNFNTDVTKTENGLVIFVENENTMNKNVTGRTLQEDCLFFLNGKVETDIKCFLEAENKNSTSLFSQIRLDAEKLGFRDNHPGDKCPINPNPYSVNKATNKRSDNETFRMSRRVTSCGGG